MMNKAWCKKFGDGGLRHLSGLFLSVFVVATLFVAQPAWAALVNASKSTAVASPTSVVADGVTVSTITVCAKKKNGGNAGSNITVTLKAGSGSSIITGSPATTPGTGCVNFTVTDTVVQSVTYTAVVGGVTITAKPTVKFALKAPTVAKNFSPATIAANGTSTLTITLTNPNASNITGATFTDTFPANLVTSGAASTTCAGGTATAGGGSLTLTGGTIPASGSCTVTVLVTSATASAGYVNTIAIGAVTSTNALANTAPAICTPTCTLTVTAISASLSTIVASPTTVLADGVSISTITVTLKDGASNPVSGKTVTLTGAPVGSVITLVSNVGGVATFAVKDATAQAVTYTANDTSDTITVAQTAMVTFVNAAIFKSFSISPIAANGTSTLTVQLTNSSNSAVSGFGFTDTYPAGLVNAGNASELVPANCGAGALTGSTGGNTLGLASTTIPKTSTCTVSVLVKSATAGTYPNTATNLTATSSSTASLVVTAISAANSTVSASPTSVAADGASVSTITVTLKDGAGNPVPGKTVSLSAATGSSVITAVSNAGGVATFTVKDTIAEGPITYTATDTTDSIVVTQTVAVTFTRMAAPTVTKSFSPGTIADNGASTLTITLTNPNTAPINGVGFTDTYPLDATGTLTNTSPLVPSNTCGGSNPTTAANGATLDLSGGTIPAQVLGVPGSCSVSVQVTVANATNPFVNSTGAVTSSNATSGTTASATLTDIGVDKILSKVVAVPTSVPADNITTSTITVTLLDGGGNPVSDDVVTLTPSGGNFSTITATCTGACTTAGTTDVNGQATFTVRDGVVQSVTYTATTIDPILITITQQATVTFGTALGGINPFNAFDKGTLPAATATTGYIMTKISGAAFTLDVVALTSAPAVFTGFIGTVKVELVDGNNGASCATYANIQTLATNPIFVATDIGRHNIPSITEPNAWKNVYVRISYPVVSPTSVSCSNDAFAIRPNSLSVSVTDADWQTAGIIRPLGNITAVGGNVHKAGQPFTVQSAAKNAVAVTTTNYAGTPVAVNCVYATPLTNTCNAGGLLPAGTSACSGTACIGTPNNITLGAAVLGVINLTTTYNEVGAFTLQLQDQAFANVDSGDGTPADCTGQYVCSTALDVGRFVPDHFAVSAASVYNRSDICTLGCGTFTYVGEPMNAVFKLTAQAAGGSTTQNYMGTLAKLNPQAAVTAYTSGPLGLGVIDTTAPRTPFAVCTATPAHPCFTPLAATAGSFASGVATNISVPLTVYRGATAVGPFAALNIGIAPLDSDGVTSVYNLDTTNVVAGASDHTNLLVTGNLLYGRINIPNAHGSELLQLPISPVTVQYWNGTSYLTNTQDSATTLSASTVSSANWINITPGNCLKLSATSTWSTTCASTSVVPATASMAFSSGKSSFTLTAPGTGITGSVDMIINSSIAPTYLPSNTTRATFGVYKGAKELIYLRENY